MDREQFNKLPLSMQVARIVDALPPDMLARVLQGEAPKVPRSPKYDYKLWRKGGYCWASEMNLDSLRYWHKKAAESAVSGGQYADKDAKKAKQLDYWIAWREVEPDARWRGERDHDVVTAAAPSRDPEIHSRDATPSADPSGGSDFADDDSIPF